MKTFLPIAVLLVAANPHHRHADRLNGAVALQVFALHTVGLALHFDGVITVVVDSVAGFGRVNLIQTVNGVENTGREYSQPRAWS